MEQAAKAQEPEEEYDPNAVTESRANEGRAEIAYLRGETNNIEEVSNANTNS